MGDGRGFVMEHRVYFDFGDGSGYRKLRRKVVVTASHCLPHPPKMPCYSYRETTYANLLAPLGEKPTVWAQCLFFDPVADVAVLGEPDNQELSEEWDNYHALVEGRNPFAIAAPESGEGYMLALDGVTWERTAAGSPHDHWGKWAFDRSDTRRTVRLANSQRKTTGCGAGLGRCGDDKPRRADAHAVERAAAHPETRASALAA